MASINDIYNLINNAKVNSTGTASWDRDENGIKTIVYEMTGLIKDRGLMVVDDVARLALLRKADTGLVIVKGVGIYQFNASGALVTLTSVLASGGGIWNKIITLPSGLSNYETIVGDGVEDTFELTHNLGTLFPQIRVYEITGANNAVPRFDYNYTSTGQNTGEIVFDAAPASESIKIILDK